ncbi:MAG: hypothetical protein J7641_16100 [Cyanobacteria bacterium SID2]|nr:hypothetical protein [Cyanobacteria bacterium SID2]MBP0006108.1 hypothetical protein [Cyanobacteria bacterium SBC]
METKELKVLLKLLGCEGYRGKLGEIKPNSKTTIAEAQSLCKKLADRDLLELTAEVTKFKIEPAGKTLLNSDIEDLPLSEESINVLNACAEKTIQPSVLKKILKEQRQTILQDLVDRGFVKAVESKIVSVTLTERGKVFLRDEYVDMSTRRNLQLMASQLTNYLQFMRTWLSDKSISATPSIPTTSGEKSLATSADKPTDDEILALIRKLDREFNTDNYLPIYHLRAKLQPLMIRDEFDNALYRLEGEDRIQLSSLQEALHYTPEQVAAGINQVNEILFFIIVN